MTISTTFKVRYHAGPYSGVRHTWAEDGEEAIAKVRAEIRGMMSLSMYSDSYRVVDANEDDGDVE